MTRIDCVVCIESGDGFVKNEIYPIVGWNNGIQICRTNEIGDGVISTFFTYECDSYLNANVYSNTEGYGKPAFADFTTVCCGRCASGN